jgi:hypothetical protein
MIVRAVLLAGLMSTGVLALAACSPKAEAPAASDADSEIVPKNPFFGKWQLVRAQVAPWWDGKGEEPVADPQLTVVDFEVNKSSGAPIMTCAKPKYSVSIISPPTLFEGNLKDPWMQSRALGFAKGPDITQLNMTCADDTRDVSLDFPMVSDDTILLGLDNVIYTLQRSPS